MGERAGEERGYNLGHHKDESDAAGVMLQLHIGGGASCALCVPGSADVHDTKPIGWMFKMKGQR